MGVHQVRLAGQFHDPGHHAEIQFVAHRYGQGPDTGLPCHLHERSRKETTHRQGHAPRIQESGQIQNVSLGPAQLAATDNVYYPQSFHAQVSSPRD